MDDNLSQNLPRLGLMGGTFDPIHYGHLAAAKAACRHFGLSRVLFLPTGNPPHKQGRQATPAKLRYDMTVLAVADQPHVRVSDLETNRQGYAYTYDTLCYFRQQFPQTQLYFITGADAVLDLPSWRKAEQLTQMCRFIAITRPGFDLRELDKLPAQMRQSILPLTIPAPAISSTEIRERIRQIRSARFLTPDAVLHYIHEHKLYRE